MQLDLLTYWYTSTAYKDEVYLFLKELDEEVAKLHIPALGVELTVLAQEDSDQKVSSLKALSSVGTTVIELKRFSRRCCRWQRIGP